MTRRTWLGRGALVLVGLFLLQGVPSNAGVCLQNPVNPSLSDPPFCIICAVTARGEECAACEKGYYLTNGTCEPCEAGVDARECQTDGCLIFPGGDPSMNIPEFCMMCDWGTCISCAEGFIISPRGGCESEGTWNYEMY